MGLAYLAMEKFQSAHDAFQSSLKGTHVKKEKEEEEEKKKKKKKKRAPLLSHSFRASGRGSGVAPQQSLVDVKNEVCYAIGSDTGGFCPTSSHSPGPALSEQLNDLSPLSPPGKTTG